MFLFRWLVYSFPSDYRTNGACVSIEAPVGTNHGRVTYAPNDPLRWPQRGLIFLLKPSNPICLWRGSFTPSISCSYSTVSFLWLPRLGFDGCLALVGSARRRHLVLRRVLPRNIIAHRNYRYVIIVNPSKLNPPHWLAIVLLIPWSRSTSALDPTSQQNRLMLSLQDGKPDAKKKQNDPCGIRPVISLYSDCYY